MSRKIFVLAGLITFFTLSIISCVPVNQDSIRTVEGEIFNITTDNPAIYDIPVAAVTWTEPHNYLQDGSHIEHAQLSNRDSEEPITAQIWYMFPPEKIGKELKGQSVELQYRVIVAQEIPVVQIVTIKAIN